MAKTNSIPPFPADIDRESFGHWLSGFTDGEGSFLLFAPRMQHCKKKQWGRAEFRIALRSDDAGILRLIQSFFGCGHITNYHNQRSKIPNAKPYSTFYVQNKGDLANIIVPHFEFFPLRAKKQKDFAVWKEAIAFIYSLKKRPKDRQPGQRGGFFANWTPLQTTRFLTMKDALRDVRKYVEA